MSAYSDYKCGALTEDEYKSNMRRECADPYDRPTCRDCASYKDCCEQVCKEGYPQCEEGTNHEEWFSDSFEIYEAMQEPEFLISNYGCDDVETILRENDSVDIQADYREWKNEDHHSDIDNRRRDNSDSTKQRMSETERYWAKFFKDICPYTGRKCEDWNCPECEVEKAEREWRENRE